MRIQRYLSSALWLDNTTPYVTQQIYRQISILALNSLLHWTVTYSCIGFNTCVICVDFVVYLCVYDARMFLNYRNLTSGFSYFYVDWDILSYKINLYIIKSKKLFNPKVVQEQWERAVCSSSTIFRWRFQVSSFLCWIYHCCRSSGCVLVGLGLPIHSNSSS